MATVGQVVVLYGVVPGIISCVTPNSHRTADIVTCRRYSAGARQYIVVYPVVRAASVVAVAIVNHDPLSGIPNQRLKCAI